MSPARNERVAAPDATLAYRQWDELFSLGLRMALGDSDEARKTGLARLARAQRLTLAERDAMWVRIVRAMGRMRGS